MKKMMLWLGTLAMVLSFAILLVSCPEDEETPSTPPVVKSDIATLQSITIDDTQRSPGTASNDYKTATPANLDLTAAQAAAGITVGITPTDSKAASAFAATSDLNAAIDWKTSGKTSALQENNYLIIRITAENGTTIQYYLFQVSIINENTNVNLNSVTIDGTVAPLAAPAATAAATTVTDYNISSEKAATGVTVTFAASSPAATAHFAIAAAKSAVIAADDWKAAGAGTGALTADPFLIIRVVSGNIAVTQYYVYQFKIQGGQVEPPESLEGKLLILQAYGSANNAEGLSNSFVELYNKSDAAIVMNGVTLFYADGTTVGSGQTNNNTEDPAWKSIDLSGKTIPAGGSFLILGANQGSAGARYIFTANEGDINDAVFNLSNRGFKVALIQGTTLTAQNPFNTDGSGKKVEGYIDMVGSANEYNGRDKIFGFETAPARNSGSAAARRTSLTDTNDNSADFEALDYRPYRQVQNDRMTDEMLVVRHPRNAKDNPGGWNPFAAPEEPPMPPEPSVKLMILQTGSIGNTSGGFERSVVELYNNTNAAIDLSNYYLHVGDSTGWIAPIKLSKSIPAKSSFLIVGDVETGVTPRAPLPSEDLHLNFKFTTGNFSVAIFNNHSETLTGNPFGNAGLADKYIDMLGIGSGVGFETAVAGGSRPQPPRRLNLTDTNDNSKDFGQIDYRNPSGINGMENGELYKYWPRNSAAGTWDPMTGEPAVHPPFPTPDGQIPSGPADALATKLLVFQAFGTVGTAAGANRSFIELYNASNETADLTNVVLFYVNYVDKSNVVVPAAVWNKIPLSGTLAKGTSLLITTKEPQNTNGRLVIPNGFADIEVQDHDFFLSNRSFAIALIRVASEDSDRVPPANPFTSNTKGYIDMVGSRNDTTYPMPAIEGTGTTAPRNSASEAIRRNSLADTNDNAADFASIRYANDATGISNELLEVRRPQNKAKGEWNPFADPAQPPVTTESKTLMILQANRQGNNNGLLATPPAPTGGGFPNPIVELYNNTDDPIVLTGNYYLHVGTTSAWAAAIPLTGTIPSKCSFLIVSSSTTNTTPRAMLPAADQTAAFTLSGDFSVAIMRTDTALTGNPFTTKGPEYVDMLGVGTGIGYEAELASTSAPQGPRRKTLNDTDNNKNDFAQMDFRGANGSQGTPDLELFKIWPRNSAAGVWNPITGLPEVHPSITAPAPNWPLGTPKLMIHQIGAATDGNVNRSFVELYNNTTSPIDLNTYSIQFASGYSTNGSGDPEATASSDAPWKKINLTGTIQPYHSYLIIGDAQTPETGVTPSLTFENTDGDIYDATLSLNNRATKVVLMSNQTLLTVQNPFTNDGAGASVAGYVDMVGTMNGTGSSQAVRGFETATFNSLSKQNGIRRKDITDTDNNSNDFVNVSYSGVSVANLALWRPKNRAFTAWNPVTGDKLTP